jgi:signal transduction histidine kinase
MVPISYGLQLLIYHVLSVAAAGVLLLCLGWGRTLFGRLLLGHALLGGAALLYVLLLNPSTETVVIIWRVMTVLAMAIVCAGLLWKFKSDAGPVQALAAVGGLWGLGIVVEDLLIPAQGAPALRAMHVFFWIFLCLLWLLLTKRVPGVGMPAQYAPHLSHVSRASRLSPAQAHSVGHLSGFGLGSESHSTHTFALSAIEGERKRIAQDIHDGVGSQLVGLIASLDANSLVHKRLRLGLECCLLDLKMAVDNMDSGNTNIFDALGSLRYRFAPSLQRAGVRMVWRVETAGPLLAVPQTSVTQVMRIVQESLANVLMHSEAKKVRVVCRYELDPPHMLLEVQDDGVGMAQGQDGAGTGKGLSGMRERAHSLGAKIEIDTKQGMGTRVRLQVPVR